MAHYQKQSWAVCEMVETISTNRIMAPALHKARLVEYRDINFSTKLSTALRRELNDALLLAIEQEFRIKTENVLQTKVDEMKKQTYDLTQRVSELEADLNAVAKGMDSSVDVLRATFPK